MIGACTLGLTHILAAVGAFLAGIATYQGGLAPTVFSGDHLFAFRSPYYSFVPPKRNSDPPNALDFVHLFAWASVFNHSVNSPPSPLPTITVASTVITVTITETATSTTTTTYPTSLPVGTKPTSRPTRPGSSKSFMEELAYHLAQILLESATLYLYLGYNLLLLECRLWQEWQYIVQRWNLHVSNCGTDSSSNDHIPSLKASYYIRNAYKKSMGQDQDDDLEKAHADDTIDVDYINDADDNVDVIHDIDVDHSIDTAHNIDAAHEVDAAHDVDVDDNLDADNENDTDEVLHASENNDSNDASTDFDEIGEYEEPDEIDSEESFQKGHDQAQIEESLSELTISEAQESEPASILTGAAYIDVRDDFDEPTIPADYNERSSSESISIGAPHVEIPSENGPFFLDDSDNSAGSATHADDDEETLSDSINIGAQDDDSDRDVEASAWDDDGVTDKSMKQASDSEEVQPLSPMNCQSRVDNFPFNKRPTYVPLCKPGTSCYTFAKRGKVWVALPGQAERIRITPKPQNGSAAQVTNFILQKERPSDTATILSPPTVRIPLASNYTNGQRLRVCKPQFVQDKILESQSRSIFPKPGANHRQKRGAARANRRARAAVAEAEDGGASSGGEGDVDDDGKEEQKLQEVDARYGGAEERQPRQVGVEGEGNGGQEACGRGGEETIQSGKEPVLKQTPESLELETGERRGGEDDHEDLISNEGPESGQACPQAGEDTTAVSSPTATEQPQWQSVMRDILASDSSNQAARTASSNTRRNPHPPSMPRSRGGQQRPPQPPQPRSNRPQNAAPYAPAWLQERFNAAGCPLRD